MKPPTIEELIGGISSSLGSHGPVIEEIETAVQSPECSLVTVGEAIEKDPDLTARLLRLANSPFYGFSSRLSTVAEAISLIGIQQVQDLILASSIVEQFTGISDEFVSMESFWKHSLACGIAERHLALDRRLPKADKLFVAGLLHDIGRLVLLAESPEAAQRVFEEYRQERQLLREAEKKVLGYDHQNIAEALMKHWKYPANLVQAVACHHQPQASVLSPKEAAVIHVSDHLVNAMQIGSSGEHFVPPLNMKAWEALELSTDDLSSMVEKIDEQLVAAQEVFLSHVAKS